MSPRPVRFDHRDVEITWLGHASVLLGLDGVRLITDPVLRDRIGPLVRIAPRGGLDVLGPVDGVLLSHLHADHADLPSLREIARAAPVVAPLGAIPWLIRRGLPDVHGLTPGREIEIGGVRVTATPAVHDGRRRPLGPRADPLGYVVSGSRSVYFAGDTDLFPGLEELRGTVAVALLPVWGWGPRLGPGHLDPERAATAAATIAPEVAIPIHWGTFAPRWPWGRMADPEAPAREFARLVKRDAPSLEVRILAPGERTRV
jgi:L-ascorbate metabolism protein UlaG (beta-lactamase superfamily)